jgi:small subunit ribosomal protein S9
MPRRKITTDEKIEKEEVKKEATEEQTEEKNLSEEEIEIKPKSRKAKAFYQGVGSRKTATATVRLYTKNKEILINGKDYKVYFPFRKLQAKVEAPFEKMKCLGKFGLTALVSGGGLSAQADAIRMAIARALVDFNPDFKKRLRRAGFLTRDARMVERKKYGLKKARRAPQWSKR